MNTFVDTVRTTLDIAEADLRAKGFDHSDIKDALEEMRSLVEPVSWRYLSPGQMGLKHVIGNLFPIVRRQAMCWIKQFQRRMSARCAVKHPWQVIVEDRLPRELFNVLNVLVSRSNFGVIVVKTRKTCVFAFTKERRVRKVFNDLTDEKLGKENFLARKIKGNKRVEAVISEEKQFGIKYMYDKETITIDFYYGFWNEHGWPQHH